MKTDPADILAVQVSGLTRDLVASNAPNIADELLAAEDGMLSLSIPVKLSLIGGKLYVKVGLTFSRKFKDEAESSAAFTDPDPNQEKMTLEEEQ